MKEALILAAAMVGQKPVDPIYQPADHCTDAQNAAFAKRVVQLSQTKDGREELLSAMSIHKYFEEHTLCVALYHPNRARFILRTILSQKTIEPEWDDEVSFMLARIKHGTLRPASFAPREAPHRMMWDDTMTFIQFLDKRPPTKEITATMEFITKNHPIPVIRQAANKALDKHRNHK